MTATWPTSTLKPGTISRRIKARTLRGTVAISGFAQRVSVPAHAWVIEYGNIAITTPAQRRAWDALEATLDGGANAILVPIVGEHDVQPQDESGFTDGTVFLDGKGFIETNIATGETVGAFVAGATTITIRLVGGGSEIEAGQHFTIGERLYRVAAVGTVINDDYEVTIRPPLRVDVATGTAVEFALLVCKCRLASDDEMHLTLQAPGHGFVNVAFVEDPN